LNQISDRLRDSSFGRKILDRWSWFQYLPIAVKVRWGGYAALGTVVLIAGIWQLSRMAGPDIPDTTALKAEQIRQQASVPPPEATPDVPPQHTGPEPKAVKGGGMPRD
jgi:hypothetical protein